jgi:hypothetical protein
MCGKKISSHFSAAHFFVEKRVGAEVGEKTAGGGLVSFTRHLYARKFWQKNGG